MPNPLEHDDKFESLFQSEILTYLSLKDDIQPGARMVSKSWQKACQAYKVSWIEALDTKSQVVVLELTSAKGKTLNGNTAKITGERDEKTHRYPIVVENWLTGESETLNIKICNLNPTATHRTDMEEDTPNLLEYSQNAKLRRSHGMMLDQMIMLGRWETNVVNGSPFAGEYMDFVRLPRNHPVLGRLNANMWTWWTVHPKLAGITTCHGAISDCIAASMVNNDPSLTMAKEDKLWPADGERGVHLVRNIARAMRSWAEQRVYETFWVSHRFKTGSILTAYRNGEFGQVYLVKGHNSVIAEMGPQLPFCCKATLLPLYDLWTYDGLITGMAMRPSAQLKKKLDAHVKKAIIERKVSWRGPIAEKWQYPAPPLPTNKNTSDNEVEMDWSIYDDGDSNPNANFEESGEIDEEHLEIARKIAKAAIAKGSVDTSLSPQNLWVLRRMGYSYSENPEGMAMWMHGAGFPLGEVMFEVDHKRGKDPNDKYIPTYNLKQVLKSISRIVKNQKIAGNIQPDELGVVRPLEKVLKQAFEEEGETAPSIVWYPPPSEEEAMYATAFGNNDAPGLVGP